MAVHLQQTQQQQQQQPTFVRSSLLIFYLFIYLSKINVFFRLWEQEAKVDRLDLANVR